MSQFSEVLVFVSIRFTTTHFLLFLDQENYFTIFSIEYFSLFLVSNFVSEDYSKFINFINNIFENSVFTSLFRLRINFREFFNDSCISVGVKFVSINLRIFSFPFHLSPINEPGYFALEFIVNYSSLWDECAFI